MTLVAITAQEAVEFVSKWHYTNSAVSGMIRLGWQIDGELVGVSIYDQGNHAMRQGVFGPEHYTHVVHHHRLAMTDDAPRFAESEFIAACLRWMRVHRPDLWAVVTYADLCQGHNGTIYRATNALFTGVSAKGNLKFRTPQDVLVTTQSIPGTWPERRRVAAERGWTEVRCKGKARYVYLLGTKVQRGVRPALLWPTFPYGEVPG